MATYNVGSLLINVAANVAQIKNDFDQIQRQVDGFSRQVTRTFKTLGVSLGTGLSVAGIVSQIQGWVSAAAEAEKATAKLTTVLRAHGVGSKAAVDAYVNIAQSIQALSQYSDETVMSVMSLLTAIGVGPAKIEPATRATLKLASVLGVDFDSAAKAVAAAMNGIYGPINRMTKSFDGLAKGSLDAEGVLKRIEQVVGDGGTAVDTYDKKLANFHNTWGELSEVMGNLFLPIAKDVLDVLSDIGHVMLQESQQGVVGWWQKELANVDKMIEQTKNSIDSLRPSIEDMPEVYGITGQAGPTAAQRLNELLERRAEVIKKIGELSAKNVETLKREESRYTGLSRIDDQRLKASKDGLKEEERLEKERLSLAEHYNDAQRKLQKEAADATRAAEEQITKDTAQEIANRMQATDSMYRDLGKSAENYYEYQELLLKDREKNYRETGASELLIEKWLASEREKIWRDWAKEHGDILSAMVASWEDYKDEALSASKTVYNTTREGLDSIKETLATSFFYSLKGKFEDIGDLWKNLMDRMRDLFFRTVAEIAAQKIMISVGATAAGAGAGAGGPLSALGLGSLFGGGASIMTATEAQRQAAYAGTGMTATEAQRQAAYAGTGAAGAGATFNPALIAGLVALGFADQATGGGATQAGSKAMKNKWANLAFPFFNPSESFKSWQDLISSPSSFFGGGGKKKPVVQLGMGGGGLEQDVRTPFGSLGILRTRNFSGGDLRPVLEAWGDIFTKLGARLSPEELLAASDMSWSGARLAGKFDAGDIEKELLGLFRNIGDEIGGELGDLIKGFDGTTEELALFVSNIDSIRDALAATEETIMTFSDAMAIAAKTEAKRIGVADINLARYQETGNLENLSNYLTGKYKLSSGTITPQWAQSMVSAWQGASPEQIYSWMEDLGMSFQELSADVGLLSEGLAVYNQATQSSTDVIERLAAATENTIGSLTKLSGTTDYPSSLAQYGIPGMLPPSKPSGDLADWLKDLERQYLVAFGATGASTWNPLEDAWKSATPQQAAALALSEEIGMRSVGDLKSARGLKAAAEAISSRGGTDWLMDWFRELRPDQYNSVLERLWSKGGRLSYQSGTDYVPRTGLYQLHQGETVVPRGKAGNVYNITIENRGVLTTPTETKRWLREAIEEINRDRIGARIATTPIVTQGLA